LFRDDAVHEFGYSTILFPAGEPGQRIFVSVLAKKNGSQVKYILYVFYSSQGEWHKEPRNEQTTVNHVKISIPGPAFSYTKSIARCRLGISEHCYGILS
jgi:hypothetical protein